MLGNVRLDCLDVEGAVVVVDFVKELEEALGVEEVDLGHVEIRPHAQLEVRQQRIEQKAIMLVEMVGAPEH